MPSNAQVAAIYVELQANTAKFKAALGDATSATKKYTAQMRAEMKQSQDSVRLLSEEMGLGLPRSLQRIISTLPGVSTAMNLAFNGVVVFALIAAVVKVTEKVVEFATKSGEAARKNAEAWQSVQGSMQLTNDDLQTTNDKIANAIAKLENKPQNGLKLAIDEAIESADKLGAKLTDDVKKIADTLKAQEPSMLSQFLNPGTQGTSDITKHAQDLQTSLAQIDMNGRTQLEALKKQGASQTQIDAATDALDAQRKAAIDKELSSYVQPQLQQTLWMNPLTHQTVTRTGDEQRSAALTNYGASLGQESDFIGLSQTNTSLTSKQDALTVAKETSADRLQALEQEIDQRKALHQISIGEEVLYWQQEASTFAAGSKEYISALQKASEAGDALLKNFGAKGELSKLAATVENVAAPSGYTVDAQGGIDRSKDSTDALAAANARAAESQALLNAQIQVEKDKLALATGAITPHAAAMDEAAAHALEYKNQLADLNKELSTLESSDAMNVALGGNADNEAKEIQVKQQIAAVEAKSQMQSLTDAQQELDTTWTGMIDSVWNELIDKANHTEQELQQIATRTIDSLNAEIAKVMTGHKANFKGVFENSAQSLAKTGLQTAEGFGAKLLGLPTHKKADGYHTWVDNLPGGADGNSAVPGMSAIDSIMGKYSPHVTGGASAISAGAGGLLGMLNDSNWASSLFGGKLFGSGSVFGRFATGGDVRGGVPIEVGELGTERFVPPSNGRIVPNKDLTSSPSIGYIDARGTDPALTRANFTRALAMTHAQAVSDAQRSIVDRQRRMPQ